MSSSTGPRTRWSAPPAGPAAGCSIPPPGAGRRTAGLRERPSSPFPGWVCGSPWRPGHNRTLFSAAACGGVLRRPAGGPGRDLQRGPGRLSGGLGAGVCRGIFSGVFGVVFRVAGMPLYVLSDGLGVCFRGRFPARRRAWSAPPRGRFRRCCLGAAGRPGGPSGKSAWRADFCPFFPAFSGPDGGVGGPGRGDFSPGRRKRTCARKVRGGIQLRVVGSARSDLCNERSFRTDVSICTIFRYGSARECVQEKCPAAGEGGTGGVLV